MNKFKIYFHTLGCPKNIVDSEVLCGLVERGGFSVVGTLVGSDICVINTCSFIESAREETFDHIQQVLEFKKKKKPDLIVIVTGCLLKNADGEFLRNKFAGVDGFVSPDDYGKFFKVVQKITVKEKSVYKDHGSNIKKKQLLFKGSDYSSRISLTRLHLAYVKVSEGCSNKCSYCSIPLIRGPHRSRKAGDILKEMEQLLSRGVKEFNLVAQDLTAWGSDRSGHSEFYSLLKKMVKLKGDFWIRLLYLHPKGISKELIDLIIDEEKICSYMDMPIQHINDKILASMNRKVLRRDIEKILEYGRKRSKGLTFRTTLIVGFPGEGKKEFEELYSFVKNARFNRLGAFVYSEEEGTNAALFPDSVPEKVKGERLHRIMQLQSEIAYEENAFKLGETRRVLVEGPAQGAGYSCWGRSQYEAPDIDPIIFIKNHKKFIPGEFINVIINDRAEYDLMGTAVKRKKK